MKKTKIICTIGPASEKEEVLVKLMENGMDIARLNFSHGDYEEHLNRINIIKKLRKETGIPTAILLDTKGPEIRTGEFEGGEAVLKAGEEFVITTKEVVGNDKLAYVTYENITKDVKPGNTILIDDGIIVLTVKEVKETEVICVIKSGGEVANRRGVNIPNVNISLPPITEKDKNDIIFGIKNDIDFIAASFVRTAGAVREIKQILKDHNAEHIQIIAKIENQEGLDNLDAIIEEADAIMVARGDLGVEIPTEQIPRVQKMMIEKCNEACKPVITATHMLDSMIRNSIPTRAEVTDVANAIYDGTDAIMLSGETAKGNYPLETLQTMVRIAEATEETLDYSLMLKIRKMARTENIANAVSFSSCATALNLDAKAIVSATFSGFTARMVSKFRPKAPIIGVSPLETVQRKMQLYWGVVPVVVNEVDSIDKIIDLAVEEIKVRKYVNQDDLVVITAGVPAATPGVTNMMRVEKVK
ncbi:pyruvate kinase [Natranaerovirga pectinivora]|uniref:Pyruvate kinase n=1 Tax=Natranaerovirga pectinivora TaxID=682400 RepID=A0A4R3MPP7_9FIRM|nr:pyruvate kinase [Natranaerovirga pectinivora]TCT16812.1 pyruvate kinase [Natranaerovirga pectinivora]